jgi:GNAT superfamily N-acetyltransferase
MVDSMSLLRQLKVATKEDVEPTVAQLSDHMTDQQRVAFQDKLERYVQKKDRDLILAVKGEQVLGLVCVIDQAEFPSSLPKQTLERLRNFACSTQLLVHPQQRKQGIGTSLQLRAEQWASERGRDGFWLVTNRMAYWYRRHFGYAEVAKINVKNTDKSVMAKKFPQIAARSRSYSKTYKR